MSKQTVNFVCGRASRLPADQAHDLIISELRDSRTPIDMQNPDGDTLLHVASRLGHRTTVRALLTAGADVNVKNQAGKKAVDEAIEKGHFDVVCLVRGAERAGSPAAKETSCFLAQDRPRRPVVSSGRNIRRHS